VSNNYVKYQKLLSRHTHRTDYYTWATKDWSVKTYTLKQCNLMPFEPFVHYKSNNLI